MDSRFFPPRRVIYIYAKKKYIYIQACSAPSEDFLQDRAINGPYETKLDPKNSPESQDTKNLTQ